MLKYSTVNSVSFLNENKMKNLIKIFMLLILLNSTYGLKSKDFCELINEKNSKHNKNKWHGSFKLKFEMFT